MKTKITLNEYLLLGGKIENLNLDNTFTTYYDKYKGLSISSISIGNKTNKFCGNNGGIQLYCVNYTNGLSHEYASMWIVTEVEFILSEKYKK